MTMADSHADALVFFGATGDLAFKKIFPALQAMAMRGTLDVPVIGVAKADWTLDQLRARAQASVEQYGGLDRDGVRAPAHTVFATSMGTTGTRRRSKRSAWHSRGLSTRRTTWRSRRRCSARWWNNWRARGARKGPGWSSRSRLARTSPPRAA